MANTYTQLYVQLVFAVKGRQSLILSTWKEPLYKYITGIVQHQGHKMLAINGMPDHIHIFIGYNPVQTIPALVETIKTDSNRYVKKMRFSPFRFSWQESYGGFSYSRSQVPAVCRYIMNQESHHRKITFREEYLDLLRKFEVDFEMKYLFDFLD